MVKDSMMEFVQRAWSDPPNSGIEIILKKYRGDTIINGHKYIKVFKMGHHSSDSSYNVSPWTSTAQYIGAVRDSNKVVYGYSANDTTERLLYDFNLSVGDTLDYYRYSSFFIPNKINGSILSSIDSVLFLLPIPHYRKRYNFNSFVVIEGVGSDIFGSDFQLSRTANFGLVCLRDKSTDIYKVSGFADSCSCFQQMILSQNEIQRDLKLVVSPNPFLNSMELKFPRGSGEIQLVDISGKIIFRKKYSNQSNYMLNTSNIPSGIYIVSVLQDEKVSRAKVIKK